MIQCEPGGHPEGNRENYSDVIPQTTNMNLNHVTKFFLNLSLVVNYNYTRKSVRLRQFYSIFWEFFILNLTFAVNLP